MDEAAETMIRNCQACMLNQPLNKYTPLQPTPLPQGPWVKDAVDLVGPIDGKCILTYIDYYSSHPEACTVSNAKDITHASTVPFGPPSPIASALGWPGLQGASAFGAEDCLSTSTHQIPIVNSVHSSR